MANIDKRRTVRQYEEKVDAWIDTVLVCAALFVLLLNIYIGAFTPIALSAITALYAIIRRDRLAPLMLSTWPILALPGFAIASTLWSIDPSVTLKSGILYLLTILIALIIGSGVDRAYLMKGVFVTFFIFCALSWLLGYSQTGTRAFKGLLASKNQMGEVGGVLVIAAMCVFCDAIFRRRTLLIFWGLFGFVVGATTLWFSEATTATIATAVSAFCTILWFLTLRFDAQSRAIVFVLSLVFSGILFGIYYFFEDYIFDYVLNVFGKDTTLTGRTDIWRAADDLIAQRPWLGIGYNTFWQSGNLEAESLWRAFGIGNRIGFNFHNTYREITVHLGFVGLSIFSIISFVGVFRLFFRLLRYPSTYTIFLSAMIVGSMIKIPFESIGFGSMQLFGVLTFAAISAGYSARNMDKRINSSP
jgi:exopolysaccharide production protein ExoQ